MKISLFVIVGIALSACGGGVSTGATCGTTGSTLTYANFGRAFMSNYCTSCHSGRDSPRLDTQAAVKANASAVDAASGAFGTVVNTLMPQGSSVATTERQKLSAWIACGAP